MITPSNPLSFKLRSTFLTGAGFAIPGTAMTYKLFVRLTTGNESGSEAITVNRPLKPPIVPLQFLLFGTPEQIEHTLASA